MAAQSILEMVKRKLPYLPADNSADSIISETIIDAYYYLQKFTELSDDDVETEESYNRLQRMLISELVVCEMLDKKVLENVAGIAGAEANAGQQLKKGKADVVEAEFGYGKASDGTFLGGSAADIYMQHAKKACEYAATLEYNLPMCGALGLGAAYDPDPFIFIPTNFNCCG